MKLFKLLLSLIVILGLLAILAGCPKIADKAISVEPKGMVYFTFFDTVSYIYSYAGDSQEDFEARCKGAADLLLEYHNLFDIYYEHTGVTNLRTLNLNAGGEAMKVDEKLIDFLLYAKELYEVTGGEMNIMMGSVLSLWHDCREQAGEKPAEARIPTEEELNEARLHTDISLLEIDKENCTVRISDPEASIDVGALGKGYATEMAAKHLESMGADHYVLNIGGNIRILGHKVDGSSWATGIKDPKDPETYAKTIQLADTSCVTSGNYERYFTVDGVKYHHIIDKDTLMPSTYFSSVSIITPDSALADALSTALFTMSYEDGLKIVEKLGNVDVLWITTDGTQYMTPGFEKLVKN